ncbi:MAG: CapA family protein [Patescibacteria group bacterium]|nr:CapA family protein [Patescibacteria group bacterium]
MNKIIITIFALSLTGIFLAFFAFQSVQPEKVLSVSSNSSQQHTQKEAIIPEIVVDEDNNFKDQWPVKILFGGDMMFDRYIRRIAQQKGYEYSMADLKELFDASDCVIANLEGPVTENESVSMGSEIGSPDNFKFTFDPAIVNILKDYNMCLTNIGNNHIGNFGLEGIAVTKKFLEDGGMHYIGDTGLSDEKRYFVEEINGVKLGFVNYNEFTTGSLEHVLEDIKNIKQESDFVIAYTHWGTEYNTLSSERDQGIAHKLVDAGVDLIIGSHPHVVQESEVYKGKTIYYSLGNLVFDQYFSEETKRGSLVQATFDVSRDTITFEEHEVKLTPSGNTLLTR